MTADAVAAPGLRAWLLAETPRSRWQARLGQAYVGWLAFLENRLALVGLGLVLALIAVAVLAPALSHQSPFAQDLGTRLRPPSADHWFGTDELGRDIYSRVLHGARITLVIVGLVVVMVAPTGLLIGTAAGYSGGWIDTVLMRVTDVVMAFPSLVLAIGLIAVFERPGLDKVFIVLVALGWTTIARVVRGEVMSLKARDFAFVGPTICYAFMQATGMVNDHLVGCFRRREIERLAES